MLCLLCSKLLHKQFRCVLKVHGVVVVPFVATGSIANRVMHFIFMFLLYDVGQNKKVFSGGMSPNLFVNSVIDHRPIG